jgi:hypothetical protein
MGGLESDERDSMEPHAAAYRAVIWQAGSPIPPWQPAGTIDAVLLHTRVESGAVHQAKINYLSSMF